MSIEERLIENGYEGVKFLTDYSYDTAVLGVSEYDRVVYDYEKMVDWLVAETEMTPEEAAEWIDYNTIRVLPYFGEGAPIIVHPLMDQA